MPSRTRNLWHIKALLDSVHLAEELSDHVQSLSCARSCLGGQVQRKRVNCFNLCLAKWQGESAAPALGRAHAGRPGRNPAAIVLSGQADVVMANGVRSRPRWARGLTRTHTQDQRVNLRPATIQLDDLQ